MKQKILLNLTPQELPQVLQTLGESLAEQKDMPHPKDVGVVISCSSWDKVKISCKAGAFGVGSELGEGLSNISLEISVKSEGAEKQLGASFPASYKALKKEMKTLFKKIKVALSNNVFPEQTIVDAFGLQSLTMTEYSGYGDEFYETYLAHVQNFVSACDNKDMEKAQLELNFITQQMKDCHASHK